MILARLGVTHQKPMRRAKEREKRKIAAFRAEVWPGLVEKIAAAGGVVLTADEVGIMMMPGVKKTWAVSGRTPVFPNRDRNHRKASVLGAVALDPSTGRVDLPCDFHPDGYVRGKQAAAFLHRVPAEYPGRPVDLVWDNLSAHKGVIVKEVVVAHPGLTPR